jgi:uncharacterized membrane protein
MTLLLFVFGGVLSSNNELRAQQPFFMGLGTLTGYTHSRPFGVSDDGTVVAGTSFNNVADNRVFLWKKQTGAVDLNLPVQVGEVILSRSGTSVFAHLLAGYSGNDGPWRWHAETGWVQLPTMFIRPDFSGRGVSADGAAASVTYYPSSGVGVGARWTASSGVQDSFEMWPNGGISADGSVLVGDHTPSSQPRARRWTAANGESSLGLDSYASRATSVSSDGSVIVGLIDVDTSPSDAVFVWTEQSGPQLLPNPPETSDVGPPAVSEDGSTILTRFNCCGTFRWSAESGWQNLGIYFGTMSSNGSVVLGFEVTTSSELVIWDEVRGKRRLRDELEGLNLGSSLTGWTLHSYFAHLSGDGRTIVGVGTNPQGDMESWIAYLGPLAVPLSGDYNADGRVDVADYVVWRKGFTTGVYSKANYNAWRANFGTTAAGAAAGALPLTNVPEPNGVSLIGIALLGLVVKYGNIFNRCRRLE